MNSKYIENLQQLRLYSNYLLNIENEITEKSSLTIRINIKYLLNLKILHLSSNSVIMKR